MYIYLNVLYKRILQNGNHITYILLLTFVLRTEIYILTNDSIKMSEDGLLKNIHMRAPLVLNKGTVPYSNSDLLLYL